MLRWPRPTSLIERPLTSHNSRKKQPLAEGERRPITVRRACKAKRPAKLLHY